MNITSIGITLISILIAIALVVAIVSAILYILMVIHSWIETKKWRW
jgi:type II secretory pathway component PulK